MIRRAVIPVAIHIALMTVSWIATEPGRGIAVVRPRDDAITLMTINVQVFLSSEGGITSNLPSLLELIGQQQADVIALQESDANTVLGANQNGVLWLARELGYHYHYGAPSAEYTTGTALLSRWPIDAAQWRVLPASASMPRAALSARVASPSGAFRVIAGHLQWAEEYLSGEPTAEYFRDQASQAEVLIELATVAEPVVVMGDFNAGPGYPGPAYDMFVERFADAWAEAGNPPGAPSGFTWPTSAPTMRIDFIWMSRGSWRVAPGATLVVGDESVSDHRAVVTLLRHERRGSRLIP